MPVYTKKDGRVAVVYYDDNGRRAWEYFGRGRAARDRAERRDLEIRLARKRGTPLAVLRQGSTLISFGEAFQFFLNARTAEVGPRTITEIVRSVSTYFMPVIGETAIGAIRPLDHAIIRKNMVDSGLKAQSINKYFNYAKQVFAWAMANDILDDDPWRRQKPMRVTQRHHIDLFTVQEFEAILRVSPDHLAWSLEMAYQTGCRPGKGELFALRWSDVDWERRAIRIHAGKTDSVRWQFVSGEFCDRMRQRWEAQKKAWPECPWICHYEGCQLGCLNRSWRTAKREAGISRPIRLYDIRHFYITHALANGMDIMELARRAGHKNADMIVHVYAHMARDLSRQDAATIPGYDPATASTAVPTPRDRQLRRWPGNNSSQNSSQPTPPHKNKENKNEAILTT